MHFPEFTPPPPPPRKTIKCLACGASHNQEKCPYCGTARQTCNCNSTLMHSILTKQFWCCSCGQEIIPTPAGSVESTNYVHKVTIKI